MRRLALLLLCLATPLLVTSPATAHVLITDTTRTKGAVLHITPDDDPVADKPSTLYFDLQELGEGDKRVRLTVTDAAGQSAQIPMQVSGTLATASYIFPVQGAYKLAFTVKDDGKTYTFKQSQRVSRGLTDSALNKPAYSWAEALLLSSVIGLALLAIVVFNRRKDIARQSTF